MVIKMIKKLILFTLVCTLVFTGAYASDAKAITIETSADKTINAGKNLILNVLVKNNPGIAVLAFDVEYNSDYFMLKTVTHFDDVFAKNNFTAGNLQKYPYKVLALYSSGNRTTNGTLLALSFYVKDNTPSGAYNIKLTNFECYNIDEQEIETNVKNLSVEVVGTDSGKNSESETENNVSGDKKPAYTTPTYSSGGGASASKNQTAKTESDDISKNEKPYKAQNSIILTIGKKDATVFGDSKLNDVAPILRNSRTMLPARFVAESLGADVFWVDAEQKVIIKKDDIEILIYIGSTKAYVNGKEEFLDSPAFLENERTYTPLRFVAEKLGAKVYWEEETQNVIIEKQ